MARITIVTNGHVSTSPRVWREANALSAHGYEVTVVGAWSSDESAARDESMAAAGRWRMLCAADIRPNTKRRVHRFATRLRWRAARELRRFGYGSIDAVTYAPHRIFSAALSTRPDLYSLHLEAGLWMGGLLARRGARIAVDVEDWHSEQIDPGDTVTKAYLREVERRVLPRALYCTVPSRAMGEGLARQYGIAQPTPIYNGDPRALLPDCGPSPNGPMRLLWFSQTLGSDRGLDDAVQALARLGDAVGWELDILSRSSPSSRAELLRGLPSSLQPRVRFLDLVPPSELPALCARYDVGLALEQQDVRSRDLTVSNKILRYAQSGVFVAATATAGHSEIIERSPLLGRTYQPRRIEPLADIVRDSAERLSELRATRSARAEEANRLYSYEAQTPVLVGLVETALRAR